MIGCVNDRIPGLIIPADILKRYITHCFHLLFIQPISHPVEKSEPFLSRAASLSLFENAVFISRNSGITDTDFFCIVFTQAICSGPPDE